MAARPGNVVSPADPEELEEFLAWLRVERGRTAHTVAAYRRDVRAYLHTLRARGRRATDATPADVEAHLERLEQAGMAPASIARALAAIRCFARFLLDEGLASHDPTARVVGVRQVVRLPKALTEHEAARLVEAPIGDGPLARRDRAMLEVLYATGMRVSELVGLEVGDLDFERGLVRVLGKGGRERMVPLGRAATAALVRWLEPGGRPEVLRARSARLHPSAALFVNARGSPLTRQGVFGIVKRHAAAVGLARKVYPHVLRHSCATHMLEHGADVRVVQELLGHASVATTQVYTRVSPEHLRRAYERAHPRAGGVLGARSRRSTAAPAQGSRSAQ
jgi:integrase/recombinase XerD